MTDERPTDSPAEPMVPSGAGTGETGPAAGEPMPEPAADAGGAPDTLANRWLSQLQAMIDSVATQATPVARQIGAKAAELTAVAADRAGPFAHKAGDAAADASEKLAQRSRELAADLRRELASAGNGSSPSDAGSAPGDAAAAATAVLDRPDEPTEPSSAPDNQPG